MPPGKEVGLGPGHIVLDGDPAPTAASPRFRPMPIVDKRSPISATAELLLILDRLQKHDTILQNVYSFISYNTLHNVFTSVEI